MEVKVKVDLNNEEVEKAYEAVQVARERYQAAIVKLNWALETANCIEIKKEPCCNHDSKVGKKILTGVKNAIKDSFDDHIL